ncbi:MAG: hypothetical protein Q8P24_16460 [Desulfobacterales bacterium]|nr:hypothetical protein [Desulfobacterales bacterium]
MTSNTSTAQLAALLSRIDDARALTPEKSMWGVWKAENTLGIVWYETGNRKLDYIAGKTLHRSDDLLERSQRARKNNTGLIRGFLLKANEQYVLLVQLADFLKEKAEGNILADMVTKLSKACGHPISTVISEQSQILAQSIAGQHSAESE